MNAAEFAALEKIQEANTNSFDGPLFAITAGPGEARMLRGKQILGSFKPPCLAGAINPIGAGDTVTAGLTHHLIQGLPAPEAFRRALAMGSASCLNRFPAEFSEQDYLRLLPEVERVHA
jgi:fructose-1-phosphate kinase PfkB-like protein